MNKGVHHSCLIVVCATEMILPFVSNIQRDIVSVSKQALTRYCRKNGFSHVCQSHFAVNSTAKISKQVFVGQCQSVRTIFTEMKRTPPKQTAKHKHPTSILCPCPQNSHFLSNFANNSTDQLSRRQKLQKAVKEYGSTVMVFHISISLMSLGAFYLAVTSGIDMSSIMSYFGANEKIQQSQLATGASSFVVAYAIHKVFAPVRIGITLSATPLIVRYLRLKGILKP